ncbi:hypothetical protein ACIRQQ_12645 [Streptomyces fuscichromogenes]|uniref:hypothetical protein n=1 Tax=Streptomyces fuscichromogenes TaxID=1324013 RepID=UPI0037F4FA40
MRAGTGPGTDEGPTVRKARKVRSLRRAWLSAAALALLALGLLGVAGAVARTLPGRVSEERAFLSARPCGPAQDAGAGDCLRTIRGTVQTAESVRSGRTTVFRVRLRPPVPAPADRPVDLDSAALSDLKPGDEVAVTAWRDLVVAVRHGSASERMGGLPDERAAPIAGTALAAGWAAVLALVAAFGTVRRARRAAARRPFTPRVRFGLPKALVVVAVPVAAGILSGAVRDGWTAVAMTAVLTTFVAVPATALALLWDRDGSPAPDPVAGPAPEPAPEPAAGPPAD